jgi:hypothetical protein
MILSALFKIKRYIIRLLNLVFTVLILFVIFFNILPFFSDKTGWLWGLLITYIVSAYLVIPISIRFKNVIFKSKHIPAYTLTPDGHPLDPVNFIFIGSKKDIDNAFAKIGWYVADKRTLYNLLKIVFKTIVNRPYNTAPFSPLYLFGRKQDFGYQKQIGNSPRRRHHIRIWAVSQKNANSLNKIDFWHKKHTDHKQTNIWVGAATEDTGWGYRHDTYQLTHSINNNSDEERQYIISKLKKSNLIDSIEFYNAKEELLNTPKPINHFITDRRICIVFIKPQQSTY